VVRDQFFKRLAAVAAATAGGSMVDQRTGVLRASKAGAAAGCGGESGGDQRGKVELAGQIDRHIVGLDERIQLLEDLVCDLTAKQADSQGEHATVARSLSPAAAQGMLEVSTALQAIKHDMQYVISELKQSQAEDISCHEGEQNEAPSQQNMRQTDAEAAIANLLTRAEGLKASLPACTAPSSADGGGRDLEMGGQGESSLVTNSASASPDMGNNKQGTVQSPTGGGGEGGEGVADMARGGVADEKNPPSWRQHKVCLIKCRVVYDV
jgi:hypothetical protein